MDTSQPIDLREYCLRDLHDSAALEYGLQSSEWQLRAASRDLMLDQNAGRAIALLLEAVEEGVTGEAQAAITSLGRTPEGFSQIKASDLPA